MRTTVYGALGVAALLGLAASARAGEPPPEPKRAQTDGERAESVLRSLKEPAEADAFTFECEMRSGGAVVGEARFAAAAGRFEGQPVWFVDEVAHVTTPGAASQTRRTGARLTQDLRLLHIEKEETAPGRETLKVEADRTPAGFAITEPKGADAPRKTTIEAPAGTTSTLAALTQFLRKCAAEPATYELQYFNLSRERVTAAKVEVKGKGALDVEGKALPAWVATVDPDPDSHFDLYFDPSDRTLLVLDVPARGLKFAKKGLFSAKAEPPLDTSKPPASAKEAGARFALGVLAGDLELFKSALDFPAMRTVEGFEGSLDAYTAKVVAAWKPAFRNVPRPQADGLARAGLVGAVETVRPDGTVLVVFGPTMPNVRYEARGKDGVWRIVRLNAD